jgi:uncharacterized delta-60 repeat protein
MKSMKHFNAGLTLRAHSIRKNSRQSLVEALETRRLFSLPFGLTDSTFGTLGHAIEPTTGYPTVGQLLVGPGGDLYVGGSSGIARFTAAGKVDTHFGTNGIATLPGGTYVTEAVDSNGLVYALVTTSNGTVLVRYTSAGVVDSTYGDGGEAQVTTDISFTPTAMAVQGDNKLIIAGTESTTSGKGAEMRVFRIGANGSLDTAFGSSGSFEANLGTNTLLTPIILDKVVGVSVSSNGDILVGGGSVSFDSSSGDLGTAAFAVARLTDSGQLDATYGSGGIARDTYATAATLSADDYFSFDVAGVLPTAFAANASGSVILGASDLSRQSPNTGEFAVSFGSTGNLIYSKNVTPDGLTDGTAVGATMLGDGRAVLMAYSTHTSLTGLAMTPISATGAAGDTVLTDDLNSLTPDLSGFYSAAIAVASSGKIIVAGTPATQAGYEVQQFNQGAASAPRLDNFANGSTNGLAYAPNGSVDLAYYNSASRDLQFAYRLRNGLWSTPITVDEHVGAGEYLSIATDPTKGNIVEIAYYSKKTKSLDVATSTNYGQTFSDKVIDGSANVGQFPSIYINGHGLASIAYYDNIAHTLRFATENSKHKWAISTIDAKGDVGRDVVLTPAPSGRLSVAYVDETHHEIKWAAQNTNGSWSAKVAAKAKKGAQGLTMNYGSLDAPAIAYQDVATGQFRLAVYTTSGGAFSTDTVAAGMGEYTGLSLPISNADPTAYAYDAAADNVQLFPDPVTAPGDSSTIVTGGGRYLTVVNTAGSSVALAAYLDTASGDLEVRPFPES